MKKKTTRPIRNWKQYNAALKQRGSLTFWVSDEAIRHWTTDEKTGKRGASQRYTALAIETVATAQAIYHLSESQIEAMTGKNVTTPFISRRRWRRSCRVVERSSGNTATALPSEGSAMKICGLTRGAIESLATVHFVSQRQKIYRAHHSTFAGGLFQKIPSLSSALP